MEIELCSDHSSAGITAPRISFSFDFCVSDNNPVDTTTTVRPNSSIDFDFCVRKSLDQQSSPADELFSEGKILPAEIKKRNPIKPSTDPGSNNSNKEIDETEEKVINTKSFWGFKRSSSLNCGNGHGRSRRSLCPLPLLSRSNSTGSTPNSLKKEINNNTKHNKQSYLKQSSSKNHQKPPVNKNYGNGVRVSPVLNVPSGNLFGIFFNKSRKK